MTRAVNFLCQMLALISVVLIPTMPWEDKDKNVAYVFLALWQLVISLAAHSFTPDGDKL